MLLKIDFKAEDVVYKAGGRLVIRVHHYAQYAYGCHLATSEGETGEDWGRANSQNYMQPKKTKYPRMKKHKTLFVGSNGGITIE